MTDRLRQLRPFGEQAGAAVAIAFMLVTFSGIAACAASETVPIKRQSVNPLTLSYAIDDPVSGEFRPGKQGGNCRSGDVIDLSVTTGARCRLMVFCIDSMMVPLPVYPDASLTPVPVSRGTIHVTLVLPNEVTGKEIYYAVAARENFSFEEITPFLDTALARLEKTPSEGRPEGLLIKELGLRFPDRGKFSSDCIYFNHLPVLNDTVSPPAP